MKPKTKTARRNPRWLQRGVRPLATIEEMMLAVAEIGYCTVLKCMPDDFPWLAENEVSRLEIASKQKWCAEAQWAGLDSYRVRITAFGKYPEEAIRSVLVTACHDIERYEKRPNEKR